MLTIPKNDHFLQVLVLHPADLTKQIKTQWERSRVSYHLTQF